MGEIPWIWIGALLTLASGVGWGLWWTERGRRLRGERHLQELRQLQAQLEAELSRHARAAEKRAEELSDLRRRLERAKKRAFESGTAEGSRQQQWQKLEARLELREHELQEALDAIGRTEAALRLARRSASDLQAELDRLRSRPAADPAESEKRLHRAEAAESRTKELQEQLRDAERETRRYRTRERTHRRLYAAIKGELDVMKDRVRALEQRTGASGRSEEDAGGSSGPSSGPASDF